MARFELRHGKYGPYFHDTERGRPDGHDLALDEVLEKLNRMESHRARLELANKGRRDGTQW